MITCQTHSVTTTALQPTTESSRSPGDDFKVHLRAQLDLGCVHFEDIVPSFDVREGDGDSAVESSRSHKSSGWWRRECGWWRRVWVMEESVGDGRGSVGDGECGWWKRECGWWRVWVMEEGVWVVEGVWVIEIDLCIRHMLYTWQYDTVYTIHTVHTVYVRIPYILYIQYMYTIHTVHTVYVYHTYCTYVHTVHTYIRTYCAYWTYLSSDSGKLVAPMMMTPSSSL